MIFLPISSHHTFRTLHHTSYHLDQRLYDELISFYDVMLITDKNKNPIHFFTNQFWEEPKFVAFFNESDAVYWKLKL